VPTAGALLASYPGRVEAVAVQYPDPQHRRQRHMVGRALVEALVGLPSGGEQRESLCPRISAPWASERDAG
jgi:hypothetical protein